MTSESPVHEVAVRIQGDLGTPPAPGSVKIVTWTKPERTRRALKALGTAWGIGLFCVILPLVHFVLVPALFIAGIVLFARIARTETTLLGGSGECPACHRSFTIARGRDSFPMAEVCEHCRANVSISRAGP